MQTQNGIYFNSLSDMVTVTYVFKHLTMCVRCIILFQSRFVLCNQPQSTKICTKSSIKMSQKLSNKYLDKTCYFIQIKIPQIVDRTWVVLIRAHTHTHTHTPRKIIKCVCYWTGSDRPATFSTVFFHYISTECVPVVLLPYLYRCQPLTRVKEPLDGTVRSVPSFRQMECYVMAH